MDSNKDDTSVLGMSILDIQKQEKEKELKKKQREYQKKYNSRPKTKERNAAKRIAEAVTKRLKKMDEDQHEICKKLGHSMGYASRNPKYYFRCSHCTVSYSDKEKIHFYKGNKCPCCHLMLRIRKTITQKKKMTLEY